MEHLRKQCGPHVSAAAKDSVEGICSKIYHISLEYVKRIREKHLAILKENNISGRGPSGRKPAVIPATLYPRPRLKGQLRLRFKATDWFREAHFFQQDLGQDLLCPLVRGLYSSKKRR